MKFLISRKISSGQLSFNWGELGRHWCCKNWKWQRLISTEWRILQRTGHGHINRASQEIYNFQSMYFHTFIESSATRWRGISCTGERYFLGPDRAGAGGLSPLERGLPEQHLSEPEQHLRHTWRPRGLRFQNCPGAQRSHGLSGFFNKHDNSFPCT